MRFVTHINIVRHYYYSNTFSQDFITRGATKEKNRSKDLTFPEQQMSHAIISISFFFN